MEPTGAVAEASLLVEAGAVGFEKEALQGTRFVCLPLVRVVEAASIREVQVCRNSS